MKRFKKRNKKTAPSAIFYRKNETFQKKGGCYE